MTEFKPGDRVLALGEVAALDDGEARIEFTEHTNGGAWVPLSSIQSAPPPPYADPELVPGMVVAAKDDPTDDREWFVIDGPTNGPAENRYKFRNVDDFRFGRISLPDQIRVVHDPRQVTS